MFSVRPAKFMQSIVMMIESGIEIAMIIVDLKFFRKRNKIKTAKIKPCIALSKSVLIVSRIESVVSQTICIDMSPGRISCISSSFL